MLRSGSRGDRPDTHGLPFSYASSTADEDLLTSILGHIHASRLPSERCWRNVLVRCTVGRRMSYLLGASVIAQLQDFAAGFPGWASWTAVLLISAIPFVESYFGSAIGIAIGLPAGVAVAAAVAGTSPDAGIRAQRGPRAQRSSAAAGPSRGRARGTKRVRCADCSTDSACPEFPTWPNSAASQILGDDGRVRRPHRRYFLADRLIVLWGVVFAALASAGLRLWRAGTTRRRRDPKGSPVRTPAIRAGAAPGHR